MPRSWMLPLAILGCSACMVGPTTRTFAPAAGPQGIGADLRLTGKSRRIQGEVLTVEDTVIVLLSANRVVLVPIRAIALGRFSRRGALIENGRARQKTLSWLKLVSRFPAGLTPDIKAKLLAVNGQTEPDWAP